MQDHCPFQILTQIALPSLARRVLLQTQDTTLRLERQRYVSRMGICRNNPMIKIICHRNCIDGANMFRRENGLLPRNDCLLRTNQTQTKFHAVIGVYMHMRYVPSYLSVMRKCTDRRNGGLVSMVDGPLHAGNLQLPYIYCYTFSAL